MSIDIRSFFRSACYALILVLFISPASAQQELQLVFGLYTTDKPTVMVQTFRPILRAIENDLHKALGKPVTIKMHISPSYESGVEAMVNGEVDFAQFGPASYVAATELNSKLRIIALSSKDGGQTTEGVICVHENSKFTTVNDLKGTRFAFGNERSTIGRYLSQAYLLEQGISTQELEYFEYLVRHDRVGHAVANGNFDAGALKAGTFNKLIKQGLPLRAIARFNNVNKPWIASSDLTDELFESLQKVMLELSAPEAFETMGVKQFVAGNDENFNSIRDAIANNEEFFRGTPPVSAAAADAQ